MKEEKVVFQPIGVIRSPHKSLQKIPIQPVFGSGIQGTVVLDEPYVDGLKGLAGFSHVFLFYHFHGSEKTCLQLKPYLSDEVQGVFATRAPHRPNKLGMSLVRLDSIEGNVLHVRDIDILDNTPLLDIKPYVQRFDSRDHTKSGWQDTIPDNTAATRGKRDFSP